MNSKFDWQPPTNRGRPSDFQLNPSLASRRLAPGASSLGPIPPLEKWARSNAEADASTSREDELDAPALSDVKEDEARWATETGVQDDHLLRGARHKRHGKETGNSVRRAMEEVEYQQRRPPSSRLLSPKPAAAKANLKPKLVENVSNNVYIPKNITVANLSRLLGTTHSELASEY